MAVFKCKCCGGDLTINEGSSVAVCDYCGTEQTVSVINDEKKINLFNRANRLRMNSEFDKAASIYEQIIAEFPEEAEAYWCLCLCNYGIEYVDDPATGLKIPTVHRASFEKLRKDENYELALEYADVGAKAIYQREAKEIDRIIGEILSISTNESPYDIFICYKETNDTGDRTTDSVIAQDIYDSLTSKGYKVFFSRITLEDKLGMQYEPYIFAALNSAKVMLAVGTDYDYYNAVWVKNEWSRFLKLMAKDKSKVLIPCYKDIDAYDMPDEFRPFQAQDMGKVGAMQDLLRGVDKIFGKDAAQQPVQEKVIVQQTVSGPTVDSYIKRANIYLADGKWQDADDYAEKALDIDPECGKAYLAKLMAELHVSDSNKLKEQEDPFDDMDNCVKASKYDSELEKKLKDDNSFIRNRIKTAELDAIYDKIKKMMADAKTGADYKLVIAELSKIKGFRDVDDKIVEYEKKIAEYDEKVCATKYDYLVKAFNAAETSENFRTILTTFKDFGPYKDSEDYKKKCSEEAVRLEAEEKEERLNHRYQEAVGKMSSGTKDAYQDAKRTFDEIADYKDSSELSDKCAEKIAEIEKAEEEKKVKIKKEADDLFNLLVEVLNLNCKISDNINLASSDVSTEELKERLNRLKSTKVKFVIEKSGLENQLSTLGLFAGSKKKELNEKISEIDKHISEVEKGLSVAFSMVLNKIKSSKAIRDLIVIDKRKIDILLKFNNFQIIREFFGPIFLGWYSQGSNGEVKPIEWQVLSWDGKTALLLSKYILDVKGFDENYPGTNIWRDSSLRKWLNNDFYNEAFTSTEKNRIKSTELVTTDAEGNNPIKTTDKVFLLDCFDVQNVAYGFENQKFSISRQTRGTDFAKKSDHLYVSSDGDSPWWCRTGSDELLNNTVSKEDYYVFGGAVSTTLVFSSVVGVRPAMYVKLESLI